MPGARLVYDAGADAERLTRPHRRQDVGQSDNTAASLACLGRDLLEEVDRRVRLADANRRPRRFLGLGPRFHEQNRS